MTARFAFALCLVACSTESSSSVGGADASVDAVGDVAADAPQDSGADTGSTACNALSNVGAVVQQMYVAAAPVTGGGGAIATGTYALTAAAVYSGPDGGVGPTGTTFADTLALSNGGAYERVVSVVNDAGLDGSPVHQNGGFAIDGGSIEVNQTCPPAPQPFTSYDSDGTKLRIYAPAGILGPGLMFEYTKQ
jgi:hypothetical protein